MQTNRKTILGIAAVIAVVVVGGFLLLSDKSADTGVVPKENSPSLLVPAPDAKPGQEEMIVAEDVPMMQTVPAEATVVTYTENGYTPASVEVKKGGAVRFENRSNRDMWPASAFHPTHTAYPEKSPNDCLGSSFDACRGVPPGESWAFTFDQVGTWRYHDHLSTAKTGTVVVSE